MPAKGRFSCPHPALRATFSLREKGHAERSTRENLLLRPWLLCPAAYTARALDRAERNGAERGDGIGAPSQGDRDLSVRRRPTPRPGWSTPSPRPRRLWSPSRRAMGRGRRWSASPPSSCTRRRCAASSTIRPSGSTGTTMGPGSTRRARHGPARPAGSPGSRTRPAGRRRRGRWAPRPTFCASPGSMGPAAIR